MRERKRDERGAIVPMVAIMLTVLLGVTAFAIDIGHQRVERRDVQAIADMVALDMARHLNGDSRAEIKNTNAFKRGAGQSVVRNLNISPLPTATVDPNQNDVVVTAGGLPIRVTIILGQFSDSGAFTNIANPAVPDAVKVTVESSVEYAFVPGTGKVSRTAIAVAESNACFQVGSSALNLDTASSALLSGLLNDALNLDVLTYDGLAGADVGLGDIATELGVGSVDQLVALESLTVAQVFVASATVLRKRGDTANANLLDQIALKVPAQSISINDLVELSTAGESALATQLNALELVQSGVFLSNGTNTLSIPDLSTKLPIVKTNLVSSLTVIEKPRRACGLPGTAAASTSQLALDLSGDLASLTIPLPLLGSLTATVHIDLDFDLAGSRARLSSVSCQSPEQWDIAVRTELASVLRLNARIELKGKIKIPLVASIEFPSENPVAITVSSGTSTGATGQHLTWTIPTDTHETKKSTGSGVLLGGFSPVLPPMSGQVVYDTLLSSPKTIDVNSGLLSVVNAVLTPVLNTLLVPVLGTVVSQLNVNLLRPLTEALGVRLAGADVWVEPNPRCGFPALRG